MLNRMPAPPLPPAVFVFDPASGTLVSQSSSAFEMLEKLNGSPAKSATLSTVERLLTAGGRTVVLPNATGAAHDMNHELRRLCYLPDGSKLALTRVWSPGTNTILIASDVSQPTQEYRRVRLGQMVVDRFMRAPTFDAALAVLLRAITLCSGWMRAEVWLPQDSDLTLQKIRSGGGARDEDAAANLPSGQGDGVAGEAWRTGHIVSRFGAETHPADERSHPWPDAAVPLKANGETVAVLAFTTGRTHPRDTLMLNLLDGMSARLGLALKCRLNAERGDITQATRGEVPTAGAPAGKHFILEL